MSAKAVKTLWSFFALFALTFGTLALLRTRGVEPDEDVFGILGLEPAEAAALALPLQILVFTIVLALTRVWQAGTPNLGWASRVPIFYFDAQDVDPRLRGGKIYQGIAIGLFVVLPFLLLLVLANQFLDASLYFSIKRGPTDLIGFDRLGHFATLQIYAATDGKIGFFRYGTADGPQYYPILTWFYALAVLLVSLYFARVLTLVFRPSKGTELRTSP